MSEGPVFFIPGQDKLTVRLVRDDFESGVWLHLRRWNPELKCVQYPVQIEWSESNKHVAQMVYTPPDETGLPFMPNDHAQWLVDQLWDLNIRPSGPRLAPGVPEEKDKRIELLQAENLQLHGMIERLLDIVAQGQHPLQRVTFPTNVKSLEPQVVPLNQPDENSEAPGGGQ